MVGFDIDADIRKAETPPGSFYRSREVYDAVCKRVFSRSWQWVGSADAISQPGHCFPFQLLEGCLDEHLLLNRDKAGNIHCLSNVCTHRGAILVQKPGACKAIRCPYHGRRFGMDGSMEFMPGFEGAMDFPRPEDHLRQLPLGGWGRFLFTALQAPCTFEEWLSGLADRAGFMPLDRLQLDSTRTRQYEFDANWMLYVDNFLEGLHIPFVHKGLNATLNTESYRTELLPWGNVQICEAAEGQTAFELPAGHPDEGKRIAAYYFWFYPNFMVNIYPWGMSINIVRPQGVNRTKVSFLAYVAQPRLLDKGAGASLDVVEFEDEAIVQSVQRGIGSRLYPRGRYSPSMEAGVHQFHRLLLRDLAPFAE